MFTLVNNTRLLKLWKCTLPAETEDVEVIIYYLGDRALSLDQFNKEITALPSTLIAVIGSELSILSVHTEKSERRKGYAMYLIAAACLDAAEKGVKKVILDDMTDHFGKKDNLYIRLGMKYINPEYPEMEGNTKEIGKVNVYINGLKSI
jgi:GNAT superfamily N-acetyltransferase